MSLREKYKPKIPNTPYIKLPLKKYNDITEGYIYTQDERSMHGKYFHMGVDYSTEWGEPVYAAASGYAIASYHRYTLRHSDKTVRLSEGKPLGNGFGLFVQIYHPEKICHVKGGRITQYGHLSKISKNITLKKTKPFKINILEDIAKKNRILKKQKRSEKELKKVLVFHEGLIKRFPWIVYKHGFNFSENLRERESYLYNISECEKLFKQENKYVTWVEQGDLIGHVGSSGLISGDLKYSEDTCKNISFFKAWDEIHLHFNEAGRDEKSGLKKESRDPYDIYKSAKWYKDVKNLKKTLFL
jgi:hypothetical protein